MTLKDLEFLFIQGWLKISSRKSKGGGGGGGGKENEPKASYIILLISEPLSFNIFICHFFLDDIDIDLVNYADYTTSYANDLESKIVIKLLGKILISFLAGSQITF